MSAKSTIAFVVLIELGRIRVLFACAAIVFLSPKSPANAQIVTDGSTGSAREFVGDEVRIDVDSGFRAGANLFFGFEDFNVDTDQSVTFVSSEGVDNVLAGVSGGRTSQINGQIELIATGSDLWLINPAGFLFGPDAAINVPGSFHVGTSEELSFGTAGRWTIGRRPGVNLSVASPAAFGFLEASDATIRVEGTKINGINNASISFVAPNVEFARDSSIVGFDSSLLIVGQGMAGDVAVDGSGTSADPNPSHILFSGSGISLVETRPQSMQFRAGTITLEDGSVASLGNASPDNDAGEIRIFGTEVVLMDGGAIISSSQFAGPGPDILVESNSLIVENESHIASLADPEFSGRAGNITISANSVQISGNNKQKPTGVFSLSALDDGDSGIVSIKADNVAIKYGNVDTSGTGVGAAGKIDIDANNSLVVQQSAISSSGVGDGRAGAIKLSGSRVEVKESAVTTSSKRAEGGRIRIVGTDIVDIADSTIITNGLNRSNGTSIVEIEGDAIALARSSIRSEFTSEPNSDGELVTGATASIRGDKITVIDQGTIIITTNDTILTGVDANIGTDLQLSDAIHLSSRSDLTDGCIGAAASNRSTFSALNQNADGQPVESLSAVPDRIDRRRAFGIELACVSLAATRHILPLPQ